MAENLNIALTVEAWADITIKEWVNKAAVLGISPYSPINLDRFVHHLVTNSAGDPVRIEFTYDYFLNFVDWGVGNGVTISDRDMMISSGATKRRPKRWFTDVFYKQLMVLTHLLAEKQAKNAALVIAANMSQYSASGSKINTKKSSGSSKSKKSGGNQGFSAKDYDRVRGRGY